MKKNGFLEGAFISTVSVIICKILGLVYVIPFYKIIGTQGGALYSYAYSIYSIFLNLATVGIPIAISKIVSEYNTLGMPELKEKSYKMGSKLITGLGILSFFLLFIFAPIIAELIIGGVEGGNSVQSVCLVIRTISTAILIVPILSVKRGYFQGHKYITAPEISSVIEQLIRVIVVVLGSYLAVKVFSLPLDISIAIAVFGATIGALVSYIYLQIKYKKNKDSFITESKEEIKDINNKDILKKIVYYAMPFVFIALIKNAYSLVDMFSVVKTLTNLGYSAVDAENVIGVMTTWASKLNMIVVAISIGLTSSLVPNIMPSFVKKDFKDVSKKINQALQILIILTIPMTIGLSFLAYPVWNAFYGYNLLGINLLKVSIFLALTLSFQSILVDTAQIMNSTKLSIGSLIFGILLKVGLNIPMMYLCDYIGVQAYYGPTIATFISQSITIIFLLYNLNKHFKIEYSSSLKMLGKVILATFIMFVILIILTVFIPLNVKSRFQSIIICGIYGLVGGMIYLFILYKLKGLDEFKSVLKKRIK